MARKLNCLRCGAQMRLIKREHLQLGKAGYLVGILDNLASGALEVDILCCPSCGKLEFFQGGWSEQDERGDTIAKLTCPQCGRSYEMDDPKCPFCGQKNNTLF